MGFNFAIIVIIIIIIIIIIILLLLLLFLMFIISCNAEILSAKKNGVQTGLISCSLIPASRHHFGLLRLFLQFSSLHE